MIPFSDLPFFLVVKNSVWSEITSPFLDSPKKTHPWIPENSSRAPLTEFLQFQYVSSTRLWRWSRYKRRVKEAKRFGWIKEHALWGPNSQILATSAQSFPELTSLRAPKPVSTGACFLSSLSAHAHAKKTPVAVHRRKMSEWSTCDHVTLPSSKWRQYLHRLFIPVQRRLTAAQYELQMHVRIFLE